MVVEQKRKKTKSSFLYFWYSIQGPGRMATMRLVWATPRADFAVLGAQLWSTMTATFPCVNNFASNSYLQPRFWYYCQIFKTTGLFLLNAGLFSFSLSEMLWDNCIFEYLHKDSNLEVSSNRGGVEQFFLKLTHHPYLDDHPCRIWDEIPNTILQSWFATISLYGYSIWTLFSKL